MGDGSVDGLHGIDAVIVEEGPDFLPQLSFCPGLFPGLLKQPATHLLDLVKQKGQHHQDGEYRAQIFFAKPVISLR
jgi:hypothetical protein